MQELLDKKTELKKELQSTYAQVNSIKSQLTQIKKQLIEVKNEKTIALRNLLEYINDTFDFEYDIFIPSRKEHSITERYIIIGLLKELGIKNDTIGEALGIHRTTVIYYNKMMPSRYKYEQEFKFLYDKHKNLFYASKEIGEYVNSISDYAGFLFSAKS